jgi:hypothetical protein
LVPKLEAMQQSDAVLYTHPGKASTESTTVDTLRSQAHHVLDLISKTRLEPHY